MTNKEAFGLAKKYIPGGVDSPVRAFGSVGGEPFVVDCGEGAYLVDIEGNRYLDFIQSWGPLIFGHCDPDIESAVIATAKKGLSFGAPSNLETKLAKLICDEFKNVEKVRFVSSGTEATMSAIRVARGFSGKDGLIKFEGCYHGHSDALLVKAGSGATTYGNASSGGVPADVVKNTYLARYNDIESVRAIFEANPGKIGALIIEPIAGNMGLVPADNEFLSELRRLCDQNGAVLIFDEVMSDDLALTNELLKKMSIENKVSVKDGNFSTLNLSQGQKKRLAMVAALLEKRKFLILDEWAADQDPEFRRHFYAEFLPGLKAQGYTVFAISHDDAYFDAADKIYEIRNGQIALVKG